MFEPPPFTLSREALAALLSRLQRGQPLIWLTYAPMLLIAQALCAFCALGASLGEPMEAGLWTGAIAAALVLRTALPWLRGAVERPPLLARARARRWLRQIDASRAGGALTQAATNRARLDASGFFIDMAPPGAVQVDGVDPVKWPHANWSEVERLMIVGGALLASSRRGFAQLRTGICVLALPSPAPLPEEIPAPLRSRALHNTPAAEAAKRPSALRAGKWLFWIATALAAALSLFSLPVPLAELWEGGGSLRGVHWLVLLHAAFQLSLVTNAWPKLWLRLCGAGGAGNSQRGSE